MLKSISNKIMFLYKIKIMGIKIQIIEEIEILMHKEITKWKMVIILNHSVYFKKLTLMK
jgi:hypothetical protein